MIYITSGATIIPLIISLFSSIGGSFVWALFNAGQICTLFCLIDIPVVPGKLITVQNGMKVLAFSIIPNPIALLSIYEFNNPDEFRKLTSNAKYHPNNFLFIIFIGLSEKCFLNNVGSSLALIAGVLVLMFFTWTLALKIEFFKKLKEKMGWSFLLGMLKENFMNIALASFIQMYYVFSIK